LVATAHQHGAGDSGGLDLKARPKKYAERRDNMSARNGKENRALARLVKTFQNVGDAKKAPLACDRKQPES
jgi:hypothetical protein